MNCSSSRPTDTKCRVEHIEENAQSYFGNGEIQASEEVRSYLEVNFCSQEIVHLGFDMICIPCTSSSECKSKKFVIFMYGMHSSIFFSSK